MPARLPNDEGAHVGTLCRVRLYDCKVVLERVD